MSQVYSCPYQPYTLNKVGVIERATWYSGLHRVNFRKSRQPGGFFHTRGLHRTRSAGTTKQSGWPQALSNQVHTHHGKRIISKESNTYRNHPPGGVPCNRDFFEPPATTGNTSCHANPFRPYLNVPAWFVQLTIQNKVKQKCPQSTFL